jgi:predicted AAA+ superfamily ATPase
VITRDIWKNIEKRLFKGKVIILIGARQVGKTTLLKALESSKKNIIRINADEPDVQAIFENPTSTFLKNEFGHLKILIIDEAQRIPNIGLKLKLITDEIKTLQVIATGSSSFDLANQVNEPLTGRKWEFHLFPVSFQEMARYHGRNAEKRLLSHRLVYGYYPEIVLSHMDAKSLLKQISDSYLYKDLLTWNKIHKSEKIIKLLQALAFQVGNQVSYSELSRLVGLDSQTIESYIILLEQAYVVFRLGTYNNNLRTELKKTRKIYFYDNGIRNALIANFQTIELRNDKGALWENFLVSERLKLNNNSGRWVNRYFWRTSAQQEVDYLEETDGKLLAFEFKWNSKSNQKITKAFTANYPDAITEIITQDNYESFITGQ